MLPSPDLALGRSLKPPVQYQVKAIHRNIVRFTAIKGNEYNSHSGPNEVSENNTRVIGCSNIRILYFQDSRRCRSNHH